ncbi:MAG: hypothetical protein J4452_00415 [Candidatus Aenigmarchaeota archaeon]|nr:hypothetical protein [Candidatus Aenigmarchaeota archaeon]
MKGFVQILELIAVILAVVVAMSVFFPGFLYNNKWSQANLLLNGRDLILTMDRTGNLYNFSFSKNDLQTFFRSITPSTNIISWSEVEGTFKDKLIIACNCSNDAFNQISSWFGPQSQFIVNGRNVAVQMCQTNLDKINSCPDGLNPKHTSDVLIIWGYKDLTSYSTQLNQFISGGNGIVEVVDFNQSSWVDSTQNSIFGLQYVDNNHKTAVDYDYFPRKPDNSSDIIYGPYKYFFNVPFPENTSSSVPSFQIEGNISSCATSAYPGFFTLNSTGYGFWICNSTSVYFDTNNNAKADVIVSAKQNFIINSTVFTLSYIVFPKAIGIKFNPPYIFADFLVNQKPPGSPPGNAWGTYYATELAPIDGNVKRILLNGSINRGQEKDVPVVILNNTNGKTAWMADFSDNGYSDDEKHLFFSLVLWASNKRPVAVLAPNLQVGYLTSYININNTDVFEVYRLGLGLGYAY